MAKNKKNIVVIGGGTGSFVALTGLKKYPVNLTAIVAMTDSGGSSGRLRDELGVLPPGDLRQCLVALSTSPQTLRTLFNYRFQEGDLKGHTLGNIFLSGLEKTTGDIGKAIKVVEKILRIQGKVVPVTLHKAELCVELVDGEIIEGEKHIDAVERESTTNKFARAKIKRAFLNEKVEANPDALSAIEKADLILIGPGDLYTSIIPNLLVPGIVSQIKTSKAKKIYAINIMTKYGQTTDYEASDHVKDLELYLGKGILDAVLINNRKPSKKTLEWYEQYGEKPVENDLEEGKYKLYSTDLLKDVIITEDESDALRRSIIRHNPEKLAKQVMEVLENFDKN
jgi:uncharacterized cofD-like protein